MRMKNEAAVVPVVCAKHPVLQRAYCPAACSTDGKCLPWLGSPVWWLAAGWIASASASFAAGVVWGREVESAAEALAAGAVWAAPSDGGAAAWSERGSVAALAGASAGAWCAPRAASAAAACPVLGTRVSPDRSSRSSESTPPVLNATGSPTEL